MPFLHGLQGLHLIRSAAAMHMRKQLHKVWFREDDRLP